MENYFSVQDVINAIETLSCSQGFYGRLLESINELDEEHFEMFKIEMENQKFKDVLDVVFYFEC